MMAAAAVARGPTVRRKKRAAERDYSAIAAKFEDDVVAGRFPACRLFRAAVEKQRREAATPPEGYAFDAVAGDKVCRRAERLPFAEGPKRGEPFQLQPWQVWLLRSLFGWADAVTGERRFRQASIWLPKGNGKSPLAALIALTVLLVAKGGDKVYSAASTQKQARHVFDAAREMLRLAPDVAEHFGLVIGEHAIKGASDNRVYEPVSSEAGSIEGIRPTVVILDEVHVLPNRKLYDNLKSATNKVDASLLVTISTAGFDMSPEAIGWGLYSRARDILEGKANDPTMFAFIVEADRKRPDGSDADPTDFDVWREANPNLGISVSIAGLKSALQTWRDVPSERASLETKHLGWWQTSASTFLDVRRWNALGDPTLSLEDLDSSWSVYVGIDLARTRDITAAVIVAARTRDDGKREYRVFTRHAYLPEKSPTVNADIRLWESQGWINLVPGETMTYRPLVGECAELAERFGNVEACIDDWGAAEVENDLTDAGLTVVSIRQGARTQSEPMKELEAAILDGRLVHDGSPLASLCAGNLQKRADRNGNIAPDRENEHKKIDVMVALINALCRAYLADDGSVITQGFIAL